MVTTRSQRRGVSPSKANDRAHDAGSTPPQHVQGELSLPHMPHVELNKEARLRLVYFISFLDILGVSLVVPLIPHLARELGASPKELGLIGSVYGALQLIGSPVVGRLSDTLGRRRILLVSLVMTAISYAILGVAGSLTMLVLSRIPVGVFKQSMSISQALVTDLTEQHERLKCLARNNASIAFGFIIGPTVGGTMSDIYGIHVPAFLGSSVFIVTVVLLVVFFPDNEHKDDKKKGAATKKAAKSSDGTGHDDKKPKSKRSWSDVMQLDEKERTAVFRLLCLRLLTSLSNQLFRGNMSAITQLQFDLGPKQNGFILSFLGALGVIVQHVLIPTLGHHHDTALLLSFALVLGVATSLLGFVPTHIYAFVVLLVPIAVGSGVVRTSTISLVTKSCSSTTVGLVLGLSGSVDSIARLLTPAVGGFIMDEYGVSALGMLAGSLMLPVPLLLKGAFPKPPATIHVHADKPYAKTQ